MVILLAALHQPPMESQGVETRSVYPRRQVITYSPPGRPALPRHGKHIGAYAPLLSCAGYRHCGGADREVAQLGIVAERLSDGERWSGQSGEEKTVRDNEWQQHHPVNIP